MTWSRAICAKGQKSGCRESLRIRRRLIDELDKLSPKDAGGRSIYKLARDAYAGPSQLKECRRTRADGICAG